ncbi:hypothetical protein D3C72_880080 [compost metagenome]
MPVARARHQLRRDRIQRREIAPHRLARRHAKQLGARRVGGIAEHPPQHEIDHRMAGPVGPAGHAQRRQQGRREVPRRRDREHARADHRLAQLLAHRQRHIRRQPREHDAVRIACSLRQLRHPRLGFVLGNARECTRGLGDVAAFGHQLVQRAAGRQRLLDIACHRREGEAVLCRERGRRAFAQHQHVMAGGAQAEAQRDDGAAVALGTEGDQDEAHGGGKVRCKNPHRSFDCGVPDSLPGRSLRSRPAWPQEACAGQRPSATRACTVSEISACTVDAAIDSGVVAERHR